LNDKNLNKIKYICINILKIQKNKNENSKIKNYYHLKSSAKTGKPTPYISKIFIGKSKPLEELCKDTPRSAHAEIIR